MATISANALGVYQTPTLSDIPMDVITLAAEDTDITDYTTAPTINNDYAIFLLSTGAFLGIGYWGGTAWTDQTATLTIMSAATSTSLEASNSISETVARNGSGGSSTYIVGGAMNWSVSVDGLLDLTSVGVGTATTLMDAAIEKYYVIAKFHTGTNVYYVGQTLIDTISMSGGVDDIATYSCSLSGYGDLYKYTTS